MVFMGNAITTIKSYTDWISSLFPENRVNDPLSANFNGLPLLFLLPACGEVSCLHLPLVATLISVTNLHIFSWVLEVFYYFFN